MSWAQKERSLKWGGVENYFPEEFLHFFKEIKETKFVLTENAKKNFRDSSSALYWAVSDVENSQEESKKSRKKVIRKEGLTLKVGGKEKYSQSCFQLARLNSSIIANKFGF